MVTTSTPEQSATVHSEALAAALVRELCENIRLAVNKFAQGILIYLAIAGFSFNLVFRPEPKVDISTMRLAAFTNVVLSLVLIVYGWLAAGFVRRTLADLRNLLAYHNLEFTVPRSGWLMWGASLLTVSVSVAIVIWAGLLLAHR